MEERKGFGSNFGFLMAAIGSAVGLGNIWGFPNKMGANGGFTFLIDEIQAADGVYDGIVINPGAYTHYSYAIYDALLAVSVPAIEVHLSNINRRESFRRISVTAPACRAQIVGHGFLGYMEAMDLLAGGGPLV